METTPEVVFKIGYLVGLGISAVFILVGFAGTVIGLIAYDSKSYGKSMFDNALSGIGWGFCGVFVSSYYYWPLHLILST